MKKSAVIAATLTVVVFLAGCGSIIHGNTEQVTFTSEPTHAIVTVNGQKLETPAVVLLKRNGKNKARFQQDGYDDKEIAVHCSVSGWFLLGNLGFGGIPGWIIDGINGSAGDLEDNIHADLIKSEISSGEKTTTSL